MNEILTIELAEAIASRKAQEDKEDYSICVIQENGHDAFKVLPTKEVQGNAVKCVCYSEPSVDGIVLPADGDGEPEPEPVKKKSGNKGRQRDIVEDVE